MDRTLPNDHRAELEAIRAAIGASQAQMASLMGISTRAYEELASGRTTARLLHVLAARYAALEFAANSDRGDILPWWIAETVEKGAVSVANKKPA